MTGEGAIADFLYAFQSIIFGAFGNLHTPVLAIFGTFAAIGLTLFLCYEVAAGAGDWRDISKRLIWIAIWLHVINLGPELPQAMMETFIELGLIAGGNQITTAEFLNPGNISSFGWDLTTPLIAAAQSLSGPIDTFTNFAMITALLGTAWFVRAAFFLLAAAVTAAILVFWIIAVAAYVLLMFSSFEKLWFLTAGAIGGVFMGCVKLLGFALVLSITSGVVQTIQVSAPIPTQDEVQYLIMTGCVVIGLSLFGGSAIAGVASGAARGMGLGTAVATVMSAGAMAGTAAAAAGPIVSGAGAVKGSLSAARSAANSASDMLAFGGSVGNAASAARQAATTSYSAATQATNSTAARMAARRGNPMMAAHTARLLAPDDESGGQINASSMK